MSWTQIKRVAWVDMRRIGPLALVLALFWLFTLGVVAVLCFTSPNFRAPVPPKFAMSFMVSTVAIYALAWGAITFSMEKSENTLAFLRSLPIAPNNVLWGKVLFGVLSTLVLAGFLMGLGFAYRSLAIERFPAAGDVQSLSLQLIATLILPLAALGLFWSQKTSKPMWAVFAAFVSTCLLVHLSGNCWEYLGLLTVSWAAGASSLFSLGILLVVMLNTRHWLQSADIGEPKRFALVTVSTSNAPLATAPKRWGFARLLWLQIRQQRLPLVVILLSFAALIHFVWQMFQKLAHNEPIENFAKLPMLWGELPMVWTCGILLFASLGFTVFRREHYERRYRLLAQLGARALSYWSSQLAAPFLAGLAFLVAFGLPQYLEQPDATSYLGMTLLAVFSVSQFWSIAIRSNILGGAMTFIATGITCAWLGVCYGIGTPYWLAGGPVIVLPLVASLLRISRWFRETKSWKQWFVPAMPLIALIGLPVAICWYRGFEVPVAPNWGGFHTVLSDIQAATAEEIESAKAYEAVFALLPQSGDSAIENTEGHLFWHARGLRPSVESGIATDEELTAWVNQNQPIIDQLVETIESESSLHAKLQPTSRSVSDQGAINADWSPAQGGSRSAAIILLARARIAEDAGEINEAWEYYASTLQLAFRQNDRFSGIDGAAVGSHIEEIVYRELVAWAMHEDNTPEQIEKAATFISMLRREMPEWTQMLRAEYAHSRANLANGASIYGENRPYTGLALIADWSPWEKRRLEKLNEWGYLAEMMSVGAAERGVDFDIPGDEAQLERFQKTTARRVHDFFYLKEYKTTAYHLSSYELVRRGAICQLSAIAHRIKNGEYPTDLSSVRLTEKELPIEFFLMDNKPLLLVGPDPVPEKLKVEGSFLYSQQSLDRYLQRSSDLPHLNMSISSNGELLRLFLLPNFDGWTREKYRDRLIRTSGAGRAQRFDDAWVPDNAETEATR